MRTRIYLFKTKDELESISYGFYEECLDSCTNYFLDEECGSFPVRGDSNCLELEIFSKFSRNDSPIQFRDNILDQARSHYDSEVIEHHNGDYSCSVRATLIYIALELIAESYRHIDGKYTMQHAVAYDYHVWAILKKSQKMLNKLSWEKRIVAMFVIVV